VRVFVDTNVLLDTLAKRDPFYEDAARIWTLAEARRFEGIVSAVSLTNVYYIIRRQASKPVALTGLRAIVSSFSLAPCDQSVINAALAADFTDFEDAVQYHSARIARADCFVTRDAKHFPDRPLEVMSPSEFLATSAFD
jgi:predicted nucleic acid-binding protein